MIRAFILATILATGLAPSVDLHSLLGKTASEIDAVLGEPRFLTIPPDGPGPRKSGRGYDLEKGGMLDVDLCDGKAYGFHLNSGVSFPSPEALLESVGLDSSAMTVAESGEGYQQRIGTLSGRSTNRLTLMVGSAGWSTLLVEFAGTPCS